MGAKERKRLLSAEEKEDFAIKISEGAKLSTLLNKYAITPLDYMLLLEKDPLFSQKIEQARRIAIELLTDDLTESPVALFPAEAASYKLKAENVKWLASKRYREIYGEKMEVNMHQTLDITDALSAARARLAPVLHQHPHTLDATPIDSIAYDVTTTGHEPVANESPPAEKLGALDEIL